MIENMDDMHYNEKEDNLSYTQNERKTPKSLKSHVLRLK